MNLFWLFLFLAVVFDILGVTTAKLHANTQAWYWLVITVIEYAFVGLFFMLSLNYKGLALANIMWASIATVSITLIGVLVFKESLTPMQFGGVGLILIGLILVNL